MYLGSDVVLFWGLVIAAIAGFVGFERGKKAERKRQESAGRSRSSLEELVGNLSQDERDGIIEESKRWRDEN